MGKTLKTDEALLKAIRDAAVSKMSEAELREQRISFILGTLKEESGVTREKVMQVLARQNGEKAA
ncbi:MAG: hypothetical protein C0511_11900 [Hyphomicrobium sp.]|nr:hypothetical protein [Hyphomicrobium sp.]